MDKARPSPLPHSLMFCQRLKLEHEFRTENKMSLENCGSEHADIFQGRSVAVSQSVDGIQNFVKNLIY